MSLDASDGAVPLGVAWSMSRWARSAIGIRDAVSVSASRFNRILKRVCLRIRIFNRKFKENLIANSRFNRNSKRM